MKSIQTKHFFKFQKKNLSIRLLFIVVFICMIIGNAYGATDPGYIPFSMDNAALFLQRTVEAKLIPCVIEGDGMKLIITRLLDFSMDWETARFRLTCAFTADYQGFIKINESGEVALSGRGLLSPVEQKLGVKLLGIEGLKFDHFGSLISEVGRIILDEGLSGKEFWQGGAPVASEILTGDNFTMLLKVALNQQLPITMADNALSVTLLRLDDLALTPEPGQLQARFALKGTYKRLMAFSFEGEASIGLNVSVDPDALAGLIRIEEVNYLNLKGIPDFLDGMIRRFINTKLKGKESRFVWN